MELLILCLKIFFARIIDVTLGTFRTILTVKSKAIQACLIGFVEALIWFLVVREALNTDSTSLWIAISYAAGYASGTLLGGKLSQKIIGGKSTMQIITDNKKIIDVISGSGYGITVVDAKGYNNSPKYMLIVETKNRNIKDLNNIIKKIDHDAFIVITETKVAHNGFIK